MPLPVLRAQPDSGLPDRLLTIDPAAVTTYLVKFLQDEIARRRGMSRVVLGLSGGVDSAVVAVLAARAFGPENVTAFMMPYKVSASTSLEHAQMLVKQLGIQSETIAITPMVDGYLNALTEPATPQRIGNICSRCRTVILFDQSMRVGGVPLGTGNKTERFFGYFTWHGDDAPPFNALGDLFKVQVWQLAEYLGVPEAIVRKAPSADLIAGQTDEGDLGIDCPTADRILVMVLRGYHDDAIAAYGFTPGQIALVRRKVAGTHWKRKGPTVAMLSETAINEYYLRPVDY